MVTRDSTKICNTNGEKVSLRDYVETIIKENMRAVDLATLERGKAAEVIQQNLIKLTENGDDRLREHVNNQISQIKSSLESAEKLEVERMSKADLSREALRRELDIITKGQQQAVDKAEQAQREVNAKSNEFRAQLADQAATLMPRAESEMRWKSNQDKLDTHIGQYNKDQTEINRRLDLSQGSGIGKHAMIGYIATGISFILSLIAIFVWVSSSPKIDRNSEFPQKTEPIIQAAKP